MSLLKSDLLTAFNSRNYSACQLDTNLSLELEATVEVLHHISNPSPKNEMILR